MSGEKRRYITIDEAQLRQLQEQDSRLRSVQQDLPDRIQAIREQTRQELMSRLTPLEQRASRQEQLAQGLTSAIADLERETSHRLQVQQQGFQIAVKQAEDRQGVALTREMFRLQTALRSSFDQARQEYLQITSEQRHEYIRLIDEHDRQFQAQLAEERQARERGEQLIIQKLETLVQDIQANKQQQSQLAQSLLTDVEQIWTQVEQEYPHQRFAPGRLQELRRGLELAKANLAAGVSQAAVATTQQSYLELVNLRLELQQKEQEWLLLYEATTQDLRSLIAEVQANRECELVVGEGSEADGFKFEVDYWTEGGLTQYQEELKGIEFELQGGETTWTSDRLKALGDRLQSYQPRLGEMVEAAKRAILSSQLRVEIADRIVETLSSFGYTLINLDQDALYEKNDPRQSYLVKVRNIAGDEVVTVISPQKNFGTNLISINTFSPTLIDETATQENAKAIFKQLETQGIQATGDLECYQQPQQGYRNLQQVQGKEIPQPQPKPEA